MLNESLGESLDPTHVYHCSIKTGPKTVIPITPRVFATFISTSMPHYVKGRESSPEIPASHYYQGADLQAFHEFQREYESILP